MESGGHISQSCTATHEVRWLASRTSRTALEILMKPTAPLKKYFRKPDLVAAKDDTICMTDMCMVAGRSAEAEWSTKLEKHGTSLTERSIVASRGRGSNTCQL